MRYLALSAILCAFLAGCAVERNRILYQRYAGYNYCHTKAEVPTPGSPGQRDIVDFYGPCDAFD
jgi:hypothetical protein